MSPSRQRQLPPLLLEKSHLGRQSQDTQVFCRSLEASGGEKLESFGQAESGLENNFRFKSRQDPRLQTGLYLEGSGLNEVCIDTLSGTVGADGR